MPEPLLEVRDLEIRYGPRVALKVEGLNLARGERLALIGPNGSGKTSLLKAIAGIVPYRGVLRFSGLDLESDDPRRARRVYLHQSPYLIAGSVFRNVAFGLRVRPRSLRPRTRAELRERVAAALAALGLEGFEHRDARGLSGGETQRVALARALVLEPELLLLDEPTAAADPASRVQILETLQALSAERGLTVIVSSHDEPLARRFAQRVLALEDGRVVSALGQQDSASALARDGKRRANKVDA